MPLGEVKICAVVPAYKVTRHIVGVVQGLFPYVEHIFVVDDACPQRSGAHLLAAIGADSRVTVITLPVVMLQRHGGARAVMLLLGYISILSCVFTQDKEKGGERGIAENCPAQAV